MSEDKFVDYFRFTSNPPTKQQLAAIGTLYNQIRQSDPCLLANNALWVEEWNRKVQPLEDTLLRPDSPFDFHISKHFTYGEFTLNEEARRFTNIDQCAIANLIAQFLEVARDKFGPLKITSGHRPPAINAAVGGAPNSEHLYKPGCGAVDVYPINGDDQAFERWLDSEWPYSLGFGIRNGKGFSHVGLRASRERIRWDY